MLSPRASIALDTIVGDSINSIDSSPCYRYHCRQFHEYRYIDIADNIDIIYNSSRRDIQESIEAISRYDYIADGYRYSTHKYRNLPSKQNKTKQQNTPLPQENKSPRKKSTVKNDSSQK